MKVLPILVTGPLVYPVVERLHQEHRKRKLAQTSDNISYLQQLYHLKEVGAITEEEYRQYKEKLAQQL